jgi:hypothetical protein
MDPFIRGIKTEDINLDGVRDIVVVGSNDIYFSGYLVSSTGWAKFFENQLDADGNPIDNNFTLFHEESFQMAGYCVDIADQDFDGTPEIFIGTGEGVYIYECDASGLPDFKRTLLTAAATKAIRVGNTDGDSWYEIVVGTGKNASVFEQNQTYDRSDHYYNEVWNSVELHEEVTDLRLGDSNVNNRTEIIITALKGYLYAYEWVANSSAIGLSPVFGMASITSNSVIESESSQNMFIAVVDNISLNPKKQLQEETWRLGIC